MARATGRKLDVIRSKGRRGSTREGVGGGVMNPKTDADALRQHKEIN